MKYNLRSCLRIFLLSGLLLLPSAVLASREMTAIEWLGKTTQAMSSISYKGVLVYSHDGALDSMSVFHQVSGAGTRERLISLNGEAREIIRDHNGVRCILPENQSVVVDTALTNRLFPTISTKQIDVRNAPYGFQLSGRGRVAGLAAVTIDILPKDAFRYGYKFWLEEQSGLLLKTMLLDRQGKVIEQMMFTQIEIGGLVSDLDFYQENSSDGFKTVGTRKIKNTIPDDNSDWRVRFIPPGFHLSSQDRIEFEGQSAVVDHRVYSDGLANVSVYLEPLKENIKVEGAESVGAVNAYSAVIGQYQVTVVGELPAKAVKRIAVSVSVAN